MKCYYCRDIKGIKVEELPEIEQAFCNEEEHELWANKNYPKKSEEKGKQHEIGWMQDRLKEMGAEVGGQKQQELL